jgi:hypothetical protein
MAQPADEARAGPDGTREGIVRHAAAAAMVQVPNSLEVNAAWEAQVAAGAAARGVAVPAPGSAPPEDSAWFQSALSRRTEGMRAPQPADEARAGPDGTREGIVRHAAAAAAEAAAASAIGLALTQAAMDGCLPLVQLLVEKGANLEPRTVRSELRCFRRFTHVR